MPTNPKLAMVVGDPPGYPIRDCVRKLADDSGFDYREIDRLPDAVRLLKRQPNLGRERAMVLLCSECAGPGPVPSAVAALKAQRGSAAWIVVYAQDRQQSGVLALDCIEAGACDYLVRTRCDLAALEEHFSYALLGRAVYPPYQRPAGGGARSCAFVVTPYHPLAYHDFLWGVLVALERRHIKPILASAERHPTFLQRKICDQIDNSQLVIANISQYSLGVNANVYFEVGYATVRQIPLHIIRHVNEEKVPSDLQGWEYLEYDTCADLALKLYFGLEP